MDESPGAPVTGAHRGGEKAERILKAARRLLAERGHAAVTVAEISREAGVSRGLLHYYFDSKEDILAQVVRRNVEASIAETERLLGAATTREELLEKFLETYQQLLARGSQGYALYYEAFVQARVHPSVQRELSALHRARREALAQSLVDAEQRGAIRLDHDPEPLAALILAISDGVALQYLSDPHMPIVEVGRILMPRLAELLGVAGPRG